MANKMMDFDPELYTRYGVFVDNELIKEFKALGTGKAMGSVMVQLLKDFIFNEQLKREFKKLGKSK